jgi:peptidoglycan/xylan/chitin deacetylase (PgdA/CDA1 family)
VRSTFFFLNESKKLEILRPETYALALGNYDLRDIEMTIRSLDIGGWEIGVHGSYDSCREARLLEKEKRELEEIVGKPIIGIRQHYLNLEVPETWELQSKAGFKYDSSFGSNDGIGFRDNKIRPFRPLSNEFLEIPLTIMDGPLFESSSNLEDAWRKCEDLIGRAESEAGLLTVLWHNNRFDDREYPGQGRIYERIIEECKRRKAWIATAGDIWSWCKDGLWNTSH